MSIPVPTSQELARASLEQDGDLSRDLFSACVHDPVLQGVIATVDTWPGERRGLTQRLRLALAYGLFLGLRIGENRADGGRPKNPPAPGNLESTSGPVEKGAPRPPSE